MPVSRCRKKGKTKKNSKGGNPQSIQRRPRVVVKTFGESVLIGPAPTVIKRRVPKAYVQGRVNKHMDVLFGLQASALVPELGRAAQDVLSGCSPSGSASAALAELMLEGVLPRKNRVSWLQDQYLGTWALPSYAVSLYFDPEDWANLCSRERLEAYSRLIQCVEVVEHQLSNGRYAVYLLKAVNFIRHFGIYRWVVRGDMPIPVEI